jgi:hypothetical protein
VVLLLADNKDHFKEHPKVQEFIQDAYHNKKFIGYNKEVQVLFKTLNLKLDEGFIELNPANLSSSGNFIQTCRLVRFWKR